MRWTHLSLYYLATYLPIAGLALLVAPDLATRLLLSNRTYDPEAMRLAGAVLLALGTLVVQIVRHRVEVLYPTTLAVRIGLLIVLALLYAGSADPFFAVIFGVVGFGVIMTAAGLYLDRRSVSAT